MKNGLLAVPVAVSLLFSLAGCGDDDRGNQAAVAACEDLADAMATNLVKCAEQTAGRGVTVSESERQEAIQQTHDQFVQDAVGGDCGSIKTVRDSESLYDECLPALDSLPCNDLLNGSLPAVCQKQLIRNE
jgi:hypothetical protein